MGAVIKMYESVYFSKREPGLYPSITKEVNDVPITNKERIGGKRTS